MEAGRCNSDSTLACEPPYAVGAALKYKNKNKNKKQKKNEGFQMATPPRIFKRNATFILDSRKSKGQNKSERVDLIPLL